MRRRIILLIALFGSLNFSNSVVNKSTEEIHSVTATYYHAVKSQCKGNHLITADGSRIDKSKLRSKKIRWVAVSRDLISKFGYGSKIYVFSDNDQLRGEWEVHDTMNKKYKKRIDFLIHESHKPPFDKPEKLLVKKL